MAQDVRFGWLGESRRAALHTLLAGLMEDWARNWWIGSAEGAIEVHAGITQSGQDKHATPWLSTGDAGALAIFAAGKDFAAIGRFLADAGTSTDADADLVQRVGEKALVDLASRVQRRAGSNKIVELSREGTPPGLVHAHLGGFGVTASIGRLALELAIDRALADRLAPPAAIARQAGLLQRQAAIQTASLEVTAVMDFGSIDLAHLSDLSVGEVLVGDRGLEEPVHIHLPGQGAVATGFLRRTGEQRAVVLDGQT